MKKEPVSYIIYFVKILKQPFFCTKFCESYYKRLSSKIFIKNVNILIIYTLLAEASNPIKWQQEMMQGVFL